MYEKEKKTLILSDNFRFSFSALNGISFSSAFSFTAENENAFRSASSIAYITKSSWS